MQTYFVQDMLADQDRELHVFFSFLNKIVCATHNESNCSVLWGKYLQIRIIINSSFASDLGRRPGEV